jgi:hypothetical protein
MDWSGKPKTVNRKLRTANTKLRCFGGTAGMGGNYFSRILDAFRAIDGRFKRFLTKTPYRLESRIKRITRISRMGFLKTAAFV